MIDLILLRVFFRYKGYRHIMTYYFVEKYTYHQFLKFEIYQEKCFPGTSNSFSSPSAST